MRNTPRMLRAITMASFIATLTWLPPIAQAQTYKLYSPSVEQGVSEVEARLFLNEDENEAVDSTSGLKVTYGYGLTDFWKTEIYAEIATEAGNTELEAIAWENIFELTEAGESWAAIGLLAEVELAAEEGHPNAFKIGPLIEKSFGQVDATVNLFLEREFGSHASDETEFSYAARLLWDLNEHFKPAIEVYGAPGPVDDFEPTDEQRHQIGPAVYGEAELELFGLHAIEYSAAALHGLTNTGSPDWTFVFRVGTEIF